jgi:hypothetical protein
MPTPAKKAAAPKRPAGWPDKLPSGAPFPMAMGELPDRLKAAMVARLALQKKQEEELAKLKKDEEFLSEFIINEVPKSKAGGIVGEHYKAEITQKEVPRVAEGGWPKVYAKIVDLYLTHKKKKDGQEDGAFALLQRRLGDAAVKEMWESGVAVPGVEKFTAIGVSITKR